MEKIKLGYKPDGKIPLMIAIKSKVSEIIIYGFVVSALNIRKCVYTGAYTEFLAGGGI